MKRKVQGEDLDAQQARNRRENENETQGARRRDLDAQQARNRRENENEAQGVR